MKFFIAVKGIIRRKDGKILIVKRSERDEHGPGMWETVGGGMNEEASLEETLRREIMEETGLAVKIVNPFNTFSFRKQNGEFKVGVTFLCDADNDRVVLSEEHSEYRWIEPQEFVYFESGPSLYDEIARYAALSGRTAEASGTTAV